MPDLNQIPVPQYQSNQPYHVDYDNIPINTLSTRDELINGEVSIQSQILVDAAGTQGTLANRLNQSIDENGNLMPVAVDQSQHNIAEHTDGTKVVNPLELTNYINLGFPSLTNPVQFVRMIAAERDKLANIANDATNMTISVQTPSNIVLFNQGPVNIADSDSITWEVDAPNTVKAVLAISTAFAHRHYYDLVPITVPSDDLIPVLNKKFKVNMLATPFIADSLRVYINGTRISSTSPTYYPVYTAGIPDTPWSTNSFTADAANGVFALTTAITGSELITIDFDISLT